MVYEDGLRNFLEVPYDQLEKINLEAVEKARSRSSVQLETEYREYLKKESRIKAITICFSDIEGRFHMLDYDKAFFLASANDLTFDGSSIRGFSSLKESDLRLKIDWPTLRHLPADIFGPGKIIIFAFILTSDKKSHPSDFRGMLKSYSDELKNKKGIKGLFSAEVEGFVVDTIDAEENYSIHKGFKLISNGGYYHSLPLDKLKTFIDRAAEAQRAMAFQNEKDHPEVAPSQFELNFTYSDALSACDKIQLYKLTCRQVAANMGMTATFLPKPIPGINGSGMHLNFSLQKNKKNLFFDKKGKDLLSVEAWNAISRLLNHAQEISLILNSSVNAYRRLDPNFEAPNQIKVSSKDRGSMIRIPSFNDKTARIEIRSVAPDANPYLASFVILKTINEGNKLKKVKGKRDRLSYLPGNINEAIKTFRASKFISNILDEETKLKYIQFKQAAADRSPKELGTKVKRSEIIYHHEITNQMLWNDF